jgi:hypothetical protein
MQKRRRRRFASKRRYSAAEGTIIADTHEIIICYEFFRMKEIKHE